MNYKLDEIFAFRIMESDFNDMNHRREIITEAYSLGQYLYPFITRGKIPCECEQTHTSIYLYRSGQVGFACRYDRFRVSVNWVLLHFAHDFRWVDINKAQASGKRKAYFTVNRRL
jgi:hypothetical protein